MSAVLVAIIGAIVTLASLYLEHRHAKRMARLEQKNDAQHAKGYGLLESIDNRTQRIDEKTDAHGEWIAAHDARWPVH